LTTEKDQRFSALADQHGLNHGLHLPAVQSGNRRIAGGRIEENMNILLSDQWNRCNQW